jgi:SPP1 gp7 family putative phage head morphogenesis protein
MWAAVTQNPLYFPKSSNKFVDFTKMVKSLGENASRVAGAISSGYYNGMTYNEIVNMVIGTRAAKYNDGMIEASNKQANYIVRTAMAHVTAQARSALYSANDDIVYAYRLVATIDGVTSDICKGWDGTVIRLDAKFKPKPPFHGRCRTVDLPEIYRDKLNDAAITRAVNFKARKGLEKGTVGQVDSKLTYYEILASQPDSQIKFALGAARADIFTNSGISPEKFREASRNQMGRPLTLAEMAKKNKKILEYMKQSKQLSRYLDD